MRILFYLNSSTMYGAPSSLVNLICGLKKIDKEIELKVIIPSNGKINEELAKKSIPFKKLLYSKWIHSYHTYLVKKKKSIIVALLWRFKNLIHHSFTNLVMLPSHILHCYQFKPDIIYVNSSISPMGAFVSFFFKSKLVWHHREILNDPVVGFSLDNSKYLVGSFMSRAKLNIFPSYYLLNTYSWLKNINDNHHVQYNGVYFKSFKPGKKIIDLNHISFGVVGRINKQKGIESLIEVFYKNGFKNVCLNIYGKGDPIYTKSLLENFKSPNISFRGFVPNENIYGEIDFLITNAENESFGRVIAEANAYGIPVIGKASGATIELIKDAVNGYLYDNSHDLILIIKEIIEKNDEIYYKELSNMSRNYFEENFSIEQNSHGVLSQLKKIL